MTKISFGQGSTKDIFEVSSNIPEFLVHFDEEHFKNTLRGKQSLILVAYDKNTPVAYTCGWVDKYNKRFNKWTCATLPSYRRKGFITKLDDMQEAWVRKQGITRIVADVNQRNIGMLVTLLKRGFYVTGYKFDVFYKTSVVFLEKSLEE